MAVASAVLVALLVSSPTVGAPSPTDARPAAADSKRNGSARGSIPEVHKRQVQRSPEPGQGRRTAPGGDALAKDKRSGVAGIVGGSSAGRRGAPPTATSQYLGTARHGTLHRLGCREARGMKGRDVPDAIVVLAFGRPRYRGGRWGVSLFGDGFASTGTIQRAAQAYARGYEECAGSGDRTRLQVALGTSNYGRGVTRKHGKAWARMVNRANEWVHRTGRQRNVSFAGASDIELGWNGPATSRRWVRGYDSAARWRFYNFGDAASCAPRGNCLGAWTQEDVWFVSWGARSAWPLPQIYTPSGSMAQQWYRLSLYAHQHHGSRMTIVGVLSQRQACRQSSDPCRGINNPPRRAWRQLQRLLNRDPRTAQPLRWVTDLRWQD